MQVLLTVLCGVALGGGGGCAFGPRELESSYGGQQGSLPQADAERLLRNIVLVRYTEGPLALKLPGANRPPVTVDDSAVRTYETPIPVETLELMTKTGWPVSVMMRLWVERLNEVTNAPTANGPVPDPTRFLQVATLLQCALDHKLASLHTESRATEVSGPLLLTSLTGAAAAEAVRWGLEFRPRGDGHTCALVREESKLVLRINPLAVGAPELNETVSLLNLRPGQDEYEVVIAPGIENDPRPPKTELRVKTRSPSQVMFYLSNGVEVPEEHLACGLVKPACDAAGRVIDGRELTRGVFEVHVSKGHKPPPCAYITVKYRGYWYYIDDRDQASKSTLSLMLGRATRPGVLPVQSSS